MTPSSTPGDHTPLSHTSTPPVHPGSAPEAPLDRRILLGAAGLAGVAALGAITSRASAGPLSPPAGAIAPTGKPIGEIEARTAVNAVNTPGNLNAAFAITTPGSYYLTGNITTSLLTAVSCVDGVTLDLNGFSITSAGYYGVTLGNRGRLLNGTISGGTVGVLGQTQCNFEDLHIFASTFRCIQAANKPIISRCRIRGNTGVGIECTADNALVEDCHFDGGGSNAFTAIYLNSYSTLRNCLIINANTGAAVGYSSRIERCSFGGCISNSATAATNGVIDGCTAAGMPAGALSAFELGDGCALLRSVATACPIGARAIGAGVRISDCDFDGNTTAVKIASTGCMVDNCRFTRNTNGVDMTNVAGNYLHRSLFMGNTSAINVNIGGNWYPTTALGGVNTATNPLASVIG